MKLRPMTAMEVFEEVHADCDNFCTKGPCSDCPYKSSINLDEDTCDAYFSVFYFDKTREEKNVKTNTEVITDILRGWKAFLPKDIIEYVARTVEFSNLSEAVNLLVTYQEFFHKKLSSSDINRVKRILTGLNNKRQGK